MNKYIKSDDIIITLSHMGYMMKDGDELHDTLMKYSNSMWWHIKDNIITNIETILERINIIETTRNN